MMACGGGGDESAGEGTRGWLCGDGVGARGSNVCPMCAQGCVTERSTMLDSPTPPPHTHTHTHAHPALHGQQAVCAEHHALLEDLVDAACGDVVLALRAL